MRSDSPESRQRAERREVCCFATGSWDLYNFLVVFATPTSQRWEGLLLFNLQTSILPQSRSPWDRLASGRWAGTRQAVEMEWSPHFSFSASGKSRHHSGGSSCSVFRRERKGESEPGADLKQTAQSHATRHLSNSPKNTRLAEDDHKTRGEPK